MNCQTQWDFGMAGVTGIARDVLRHLMRERGATQAQLGQVLGITQVAVSGRVRGKTPLSLADIDRLARHFDVSPAVFVDPRIYARS